MLIVRFVLHVPAWSDGGVEIWPFLPNSYFMVLGMTRDSLGGTEIELRDVHTDPDLARGLTLAEARLMALNELSVRVGVDRAELMIDQPEGLAMVESYLGKSQPMTARDTELNASNFLAESAAYRANQRGHDEIRAWQRAEALRRLREDPHALFQAACHSTPTLMQRVIAAHAVLDFRDRCGRPAAMIAAVAWCWLAMASLVDTGRQTRCSILFDDLEMVKHFILDGMRNPRVIGFWEELSYRN
jgi:hypothetical protein